jgi:hypothetical protein
LSCPRACRRRLRVRFPRAARPRRRAAAAPAPGTSLRRRHHAVGDPIAAP